MVCACLSPRLVPAALPLVQLGITKTQKRKSGLARKKARLQIVFYAGQAACSGQTELDVLAAVALGLVGFVAVRLKGITSLLPRAASEVSVCECRPPTHFSRSAILSKRHAYLVRNVSLRSTFDLWAHQKGHPMCPPLRFLLHVLAQPTSGTISARSFWSAEYLLHLRHTSAEFRGNSRFWAHQKGHPMPPLRFLPYMQAQPNFGTKFA